MDAGHPDNYNSIQRANQSNCFMEQMGMTSVSVIFLSENIRSKNWHCTASRLPFYGAISKFCKHSFHAVFFLRPFLGKIPLISGFS